MPVKLLPRKSGMSTVRSPYVINGDKMPKQFPVSMWKDIVLQLSREIYEWAEPENSMYELMNYGILPILCR